VSGAGAIVTHNVKDFPTGKVPGGLDVVSPVAFAANTVPWIRSGHLTRSSL
jgi:hypothetical protein